MKIKELYIKNFGKFQEEKITFHDGINIFYGENESGKTTIHTFIKSMLFGMERGRGRASVGDTFSLYEPWKNPNYYAGVLRFETGGKNFRLERNFDKYSKNASLICEDDGEEFSLEHGDLEMILGGLNASNYENTVSIGQMKIETNQSLAVELQNYATNYYATGNSEIDLDGALSLLAKKKKDVEREMKEEIQEKQQKRYTIEQELSYVWRDMQKIGQELVEVEHRIDSVEQTQIDEEIKRQEALQEAQTKGEKKRSGVFFAMVSFAVALTLLLDKPWNYLAGISFVLAGTIYMWKNRKSRKQEPKLENVEQRNNPMEKLLWEKERLQSEYKEKQVQYSNIQEQLQELEEVSEAYRQQDKRKQALELAVQRMMELSKDVHKELGTRLNAKASAILKEITGGRYEMLLIDEKLKMSLYTGEQKISIEQVSRGTIEQIYFALRMAASDILYEEEYPVVLDDTFVFYDDVRLENTLRWLEKNKKQVLIFTCQKREERMLSEM